MKKSQKFGPYDTTMATGCPVALYQPFFCPVNDGCLVDMKKICHFSGREYLFLVHVFPLIFLLILTSYFRAVKGKNTFLLEFWIILGHSPSEFATGRSSVWLECVVRVHEVVGSNPIAPTI